MAGKKLTIALTAEQRKQIKDATGKSIKELNVDLASTGGLSDKDLEAVTGGAGGTTPIKID
jgi:cell division protein ZapA (FtsZ GTPase activity inhibitor)